MEWSLPDDPVLSRTVPARSWRRSSGAGPIAGPDAVTAVRRAGTIVELAGIGIVALEQADGAAGTVHVTGVDAAAGQLAVAVVVTVETTATAAVAAIECAGATVAVGLDVVERIGDHVARRSDLAIGAAIGDATTCEIARTT